MALRSIIQHLRGNPESVGALERYRNAPMRLSLLLEILYTSW